MADIQLILAASGDRAARSIQGTGNYVYCYDQEGLVEIQLLANNEIKERHIVERFVTLNDRFFDEIKIINISGEDNNIRFFTGLGTYTASQDRANVSIDIADDKLPVSIADTVSVTLDAGQLALTINSFDVANGSSVLPDIEVPAGQQVVLFPADNDRIQAIVQSIDKNTGVVRIAPHGSASSNTGEILSPFGSAKYKTVTAITAFNSGTESVWLARNELTRV